MAASLIETKHRINTIESTEKITKAMKLVSSVKYQKWKKIYDENLIYSVRMKEIFLKTYVNVDTKAMNLGTYLRSFNDTRNLYIIVSSSLGLCGSYNYNLYRLLDSRLKDDDELLVIGQKGLLHYRNYKNKIYDTYVNLFDNFNYNNVRLLRHFIFKLYRSSNYKSISMCYTHYKNSMSYVPVIEQIVPFNINKDDEKLFDKHFPPVFAPDAKEVCKLIFPHYVDSILYNKLVSSGLSEHASRRNAMENASKNASEIVEDLKLVYNKSRQEHITQEIAEVASGASSNS